MNVGLVHLSHQESFEDLGISCTDIPMEAQQFIGLRSLALCPRLLLGLEEQHPWKAFVLGFFDMYVCSSV